LADEHQGTGFIKRALGRGRELGAAVVRSQGSLIVVPMGIEELTQQPFNGGATTAQTPFSAKAIDPADHVVREFQRDPASLLLVVALLCHLDVPVPLSDPADRA
jgi:hypothetical protein